MTTPLLQEERPPQREPGGAAADREAAAALLAAQQPERSRSGLESAASANSVSGLSQTSQGRRLAASLEFPIDHFSFGDIAGLGLPSSVGGLLQHDYFNRGKGLHEEVRERLHLPALVESGRHAGRSRVVHQGAGIGLHLLTRDFFITMLQTPLVSLLSLVALVYLATFFFWGGVWYLIVRFYPGCLYGAETFVESFTFSIITQMTIGYGNTGPQRCAAAALIIVVQSVSELLINAAVLGLIFAKVASPKHRAFSIYISDSAVITRRDGILKFMFRVADVRRTQVIEPRVRAYLYTWGAGRVTAEGERIQVRCERLDIDYIDGMLLLPLIIEHTIDERSPLCGHTYDSLAAMNAEIVVTFEAATEMGNTFFARQSYLAQEINWSCHFEEIIGKPVAGREQRYSVDLNRFHNVMCPEAEDASQASRLVVNRAKRAVPYPLLGENTLVLSDVLCVRPCAANDSAMELVCRVADTYPSQMVEVVARVFLYRWRPADWCAAHPDLPSFTLDQLPCGHRDGTDRLYLRLPQEVVHTIDAASPLASWLQPGGLSADADSEIVVLLQAYLHVSAQNRMRQRTYRVGQHVRYGFTFSPAVRPPAECGDGKPRVRWSRFFDIEPVGWAAGGGRPTVHVHPSALSHPAVRAFLHRGNTSVAPESHAQVRAQQDRDPRLADALDHPLPTSPRARWVAAARAAARAAAAAEREARQEAPAAAAAAGQPHGGLEPVRAGPALEHGLQRAADVVGRGSTATPQVPMDPDEPMLGPPSRAAPLQAGTAWPPPPPQQQQQAGAGWSAQQRAAGRGGRLVGPPDLSTLSAGGSVSLDRYAAEPARRSEEEEGLMAAAPPLPPSRTSAAVFHPSPYDQPAAWRAQPAAQQYSQDAQQQQYGQQQQYHGFPDVLESDLTAMPGVPMDRYAAMVAGPTPDIASPPLAAGGLAAAAAAARPHASSAAITMREAGGGVAAAAQSAAPGGSWRRRRSLAQMQANLQAIWEQPEQAAGSPSDSEGEGEG